MLFMISLSLIIAGRYRFVPVIIVLPLLSVLVSCGFSVDDERAYQSADQEHMQSLMKLLNQRGIPFESIDGMIRYKRSVKAEFDKAQRAFGSATSVQFVDPDVREYFHNILNTEGIEYIEPDRDRDGGGWTMWWPGSEDRKMNILNQAVEYKITLQMEEDSDCETGSSNELAKPFFIVDAPMGQAGLVRLNPN